MPRQPVPEHQEHQVLRGRRSDNWVAWLEDLEGATRATGCYDLFFPDMGEEWPQEDIAASRAEGTWQSLAWRLRSHTAVQILGAFISGPLWAHMLTRWPNEDPLIDRLPSVVDMAHDAYKRFQVAPATERERNRMLYELENGDPREYPSEAHFMEAREWLEVAVHLSTSKEAVEARKRARKGLSPLRLKVEQGQGQALAQPLAEVPNSSARRRQRDDAEDALEGPQRSRVKLEP
ncbi:hypothetical protein VPNG_07403 [Cytospora leucostoma]|uniref:Uncharacterized protein n=1 Tax=Cytospora leucostoma TaxID=1230097 RepID=A0A423WMY2_9PEZI|nr:hypothetical protein VPNG_07403 [Cytospora leucostoma]